MGTMAKVLVVIVVVALLIGANALVYFAWHNSPKNEGKSGVPIIAGLVAIEVAAGAAALLTG